MTVRMRHTRGHTNNRRAHHALAKPALTKESSGNVHVMHRLDPKTGTYRGRKVLDLTTKLEKRAKKTKAKETSR
jgi:ribosomal protein L32